MLKLLHNKKSQSSSPYTQPIVFSYRFLQALFAIEHDFDGREKFKIRSNGQGRLLHHVTKADLQLATILHVFSLDGTLSEIPSRHFLYQQMAAFYEAPVNKDQFYAAFEKFVACGLMQARLENELIELNLAHFTDPETGKMGRFVLLPQLVFEKAFTDLPIALQKFYYHACAQQGEEHYKLLQLNFDKLSVFMHRYETGHLNKLLSQAAHVETSRGEKLFKLVRIERNAAGQPKAVYQVNKDLLPRYTPGVHYHEALPLKKSYKRLLRRLTALLDKVGIGEFAYWQQGRPLYELALMLKDKSESYWYIVIERLRKQFVTTGFFAKDLIEQIRTELHDQVSSYVLGTLRRYGLLSFVKPGESKSFCDQMRSVPRAAFRQACRVAAPALYKTHSRPAVFNTLDYKVRSLALDELEAWMPLEYYRQQAYGLQVEPKAFIAALYQAYDLITHHGLSYQQAEDWLAGQLHKLPQWKPVADPPSGFDLATFLQSYMQA